MKTKLEIIEEINAKYDQNYKISNSGRIYMDFMGKKIYLKLDEIIHSWKEFEMKKNSSENCKIVCSFIEKNGGELITKSATGSVYYMYKGNKIRVSDHDFLSEKYYEPDMNLCSYEQNGHVQMIERLKAL